MPLASQIATRRSVIAGAVGRRLCTTASTSEGRTNPGDRLVRAAAVQSTSAGSRGLQAVRWSGCSCEPSATRLLDPPRSPRSGAGTTNAPTAPRNREHSRARTRRCRRAPRASRRRNRCAAYRDSRSRLRSVKGCRNPSIRQLWTRVFRRRKHSSTRTIASILRSARCRAIASATLGLPPLSPASVAVRLRQCTRWAGEAAIRPRLHSAPA